MGVIEDERHSLIESSKFNECRNSLAFFQTINDSNRDFAKLDKFEKVFWLQTNSDILHKLDIICTNIWNKMFIFQKKICTSTLILYSSPVFAKL